MLIPKAKTSIFISEKNSAESKIALKTELPIAMIVFAKSL